MERGGEEGCIVMCEGEWRWRRDRCSWVQERETHLPGRGGGSRDSQGLPTALPPLDDTTNWGQQTGHHSAAGEVEAEVVVCQGVITHS